jgi:hypothetical protein
MPRENIVSMRFSDEDLEAMKVEADLLGMTFADYVRKLMSYRHVLRQQLLEDLKTRVRMFEERIQKENV